MKSQLRRLIMGEGGQDLIEYALLASLLSIVSILALGTLGIEVRNVFRTITMNFLRT